MDVRALRGPFVRHVLRTAGAIIPDDVPLGDPALLLPYAFPECHRACKPKHKVCVVTHGIDRLHFTQAQQMHIPVRSARGSHPLAMLAFVLDCGLVISSSLHGLIFPEVFGVPARWIVLPQGVPRRYAAPALVG